MNTQKPKTKNPEEEKKAARGVLVSSSIVRCWVWCSSRLPSKTTKTLKNKKAFGFAKFELSEMAWLTRFLAVVAFLAIVVIFSPETFGSKSDGLNSITISTYLKLAHHHVQESSEASVW
ncbi:unnamed protein product [Prunus brigantina]